MNLLVFVLSFLMLIAAISYQGLAHYKSNALIRGIWDRIIRIEEPCAFNQAVQAEYRLLKGASVSKKKQLEDEEKEDGEAKGSAKINFRFLIDPEMVSKHPKETEQMELLLKNLIAQLYGDQPFFKDLVEKRPTIVADMLHALRTFSEELGDKKINTIEKLTQVGLKDETLENLWHQLLRNNPVSNATKERLFNLSNDPELCYQTNLTKYLSNSNVQQIRLYLAPRPLLLALLEDPALVDDLLKKRKELYKAVKKKNNPMTPDAATNELKTFASKFPTLAPYEAILNYKVTKTNPSDYE